MKDGHENDSGCRRLTIYMIVIRDWDMGAMMGILSRTHYSGRIQKRAYVYSFVYLY